jgi:hypothetical protein
MAYAGRRWLFGCMVFLMIWALSKMIMLFFDSQSVTHHAKIMSVIHQSTFIVHDSFTAFAKKKASIVEKFKSNLITY